MGVGWLWRCGRGSVSQFRFSMDFVTIAIDCNLSGFGSSLAGFACQKRNQHSSFFFSFVRYRNCCFHDALGRTGFLFRFLFHICSCSCIRVGSSAKHLQLESNSISVSRVLLLTKDSKIIDSNDWIYEQVHNRRQLGLCVICNPALQVTLL